LEFYRSLWREDLLPRANFADNGSTWGSDFRAGGDNLCIPRGAENPSGAWQFAKFLLDLPQTAPT
jgi:multiple sugar transport system substrate-binding protein